MRPSARRRTRPTARRTSLAGDYDLAIADGGSCTGSAILEYDEAPSGTELPMPAGVAASATIVAQEKMPLGTDVVLSVTPP